jgi:hypothetical protein
MSNQWYSKAEKKEHIKEIKLLRRLKTREQSDSDRK